jgi:hypothetical protein
LPASSMLASTPTDVLLADAMFDLHGGLKIGAA